jgi:hypothetical protein
VDGLRLTVDGIRWTVHGLRYTVHGGDGIGVFSQKVGKDSFFVVGRGLNPPIVLS